jgi:uncharacterized protein YndB with AHSA1/START domain
VLWIILIVLAVLVVALVIFIAMQPTEFRITRSATISAPPAAVFAHINDFQKWQRWSPWEKMDPNLTRTFGGASGGKGAIYAWAGNKKVGEGRMTILDSTPAQLIQIQLEFLKPFRATNTAEFTFQPQANQTLLTWSMTGKRTFMFKAFGLLMNMDKLIGGDFERGLANLKSVVEIDS